MRVLLVLALVGAVIWALVEVLQADRSAVRGLPRLAWIPVVLTGVGAIAWFFLGRPKPGEPGSQGGPRPAPPRRPAPDDDPEFLRSLNHETEHQRMIRRWEEDLHRGETGTHSGDSDPPDETPPGRRPPRK